MRLGPDVLGMDLYLVLGVGRNATAKQIRRAYLGKVRASHPDLNPADGQASARMARINVASRILLDPALRFVYDQARNSRGDQVPTATAWYERVAVPSGEDWSPAPARRRQKYRPALLFLGRKLRSFWSRHSLAISEGLDGLPRRTRLFATTLLLVAAFWLIAAARPRNLIAGPGGAQPTSVSPTVLNP